MLCRTLRRRTGSRTTAASADRAAGSAQPPLSGRGPDGTRGSTGAVRLAYRSSAASELAPDSLNGQSPSRVAVQLLRGVICFLLFVAAGFCDWELPLACAQATPPPATTAMATASASMRFMRVIPPPFDAAWIQAARG